MRASWMSGALLALPLSIAPACDETSKAPPAPDPSKVASAAPSASAREGGRGDGSGEGKGEGRNRAKEGDEGKEEGSGEGKKGDDVCPPTVEGAKTTVKDTDLGVVLEVVAESESAQKAIGERANLLLERQRAASEEKAAHSGTGSGGGLGRCPIVIRGTKITLEPIPASAGSPGGTRVQVDALKTEEVDSLRRETKQRLAALEKSP